MYREYEKALDDICREAEGRGNADFYDHLADKVDDLSKGWKVKHGGGDLTPDEMTKLIERKHWIIDWLNRMKEEDKRQS